MPSFPLVLAVVLYSFFQSLASLIPPCHSIPCYAMSLLIYPNQLINQSINHLYSSISHHNILTIIVITSTIYLPCLTLPSCHCISRGFCLFGIYTCIHPSSHPFIPSCCALVITMPPCPSAPSYQRACMHTTDVTHAR